MGSKSIVIRVGDVDDHPVVTDGLALALSQSSDIEVACTAASLEAAFASYRQRERRFGRTSEQLAEGEPLPKTG